MKAQTVSLTGQVFPSSFNISISSNGEFHAAASDAKGAFDFHTRKSADLNQNVATLTVDLGLQEISDKWTLRNDLSSIARANLDIFGMANGVGIHFEPEFLNVGATSEPADNYALPRDWLPDPSDRLSTAELLEFQKLYPVTVSIILSDYRRAIREASETPMWCFRILDGVRIAYCRIASWPESALDDSKLRLKAWAELRDLLQMERYEDLESASKTLRHGDIISIVSAEDRKKFIIYTTRFVGRFIKHVLKNQKTI